MLSLQIGVLLVFGVGIGAFLGTFISVSQMLPRVTDYSPPEVTKIYSSDDVLLATMGLENREFVSLKQIPKDLVTAIVAIEDSRFYEHAGLDVRSIGRAVLANILGGGIVQGGSTITQQLARNVFLTQRRTFTRKAREAILAVMIERNYTKPKILELYLNQVYFGSGAYGVEAASKIYFGKSVDSLDLAESALLAGLPRAPTDLSPHTNLNEAIRRRNRVLARMVELGKITPEERDNAEAETPHIVPLTPTKYRSKAPYFTDYVRSCLKENYHYGDNLIYQGGLRVYTTLNYEMQQAAERALREGILDARRRRLINSTQGNGALICIEPENGYIRAMVGGADYTSKWSGQWNRAVQAQRQPGSSFKIFVYTAAVDVLGWDANHTVEGGRFSYPSGHRVWRPRNYDGRWWPDMTMRRAVAKSVNIPAIKTAMEVGLYTVVKYAHLMGVKSEVQPYPALAIGGISGIRPIEMAAAYGVIASGGYYAEPTPIVRITDNRGDVVDERRSEAKRVLPDRTVKIMDELFRAVVTTGTGTAVSSVPDARGKTGTTNDDVDAWFIGYVPQKLVTAVWAGNDNHRPMRHVWGGNVCAPIWRDFMGEALTTYRETHRPKPRPKPEEKRESRKEHPPEHKTPEGTATPAATSDQDKETSSETVTVRVCDESELLATRSCPSTHLYTYVKGTEPTEHCNIHGPTGGARPNGPPAPPTEKPAGGPERPLRLTPPPPILPDR